MFAELSELEQGKVREAIIRLMEVNLLVKEKDRDTYATIRRHRVVLESYFHFLGWELTVDERHECVFLLIPDGRLRKRLDRDHTIWLLVLRLLYEEKRQGLSLSEYPMITLYEIRSKYATFRLNFVNKTTLDKLIQYTAQSQLIDTMDEDNRSDDARFKLFHTWMYLIQMDELSLLRERLDRYVTTEAGGLMDEMDDAASFD